MRNYFCDIREIKCCGQPVLWCTDLAAVRDLAAPELLKKCLHRRTQNPNESVNAVSYTHLDVYKRQEYDNNVECIKNCTKFHVYQNTCCNNHLKRCV